MPKSKENYWDERLTDWFLTFRDKVRILEPECVRQRLFQIAKNVTEIYEDDSRDTGTGKQPQR